MSNIAPLTNPLIENNYFYLSSDGTYYIVGDENTCAGASNPLVSEIGHLDIPAEYNGKPVKEIGSYAFCGCSSLTSIEIPYCITAIGDQAFSGCKALTSITVDPANIVYKSDGNCIIEKATNKLIAGCKTSIIPNYITSIGEYAFYECTALTSITIPDSVTSIGNYAFAGCSGCISLTSVTIGNGVTSIGEYAFYNCKALTSINISNSVTSIRSGTFSHCYALTSINIPASVTSIVDGAFMSCSALKNVIVNGKPTIKSNAFNYTPKLEKIYVIEGKGYSPTDKIDGKPIEIIPANGAVIAKTMTVKTMTIS